jgi:hypothetical protein
MDHINELADILNESLKWNKARIDCFAKMLLALFTVKTINLTELSCAFMSNALQESRYKRLVRFFRLFNIDFNVIAEIIFKLFMFNEGNYYLTMDRTNWQWGKSKINVLMLGIVYKGVAIPIYWELLNKKGNSDTEERIKLIQKFIDKFGKTRIEGLLADREFVGHNWFEWLIKEQLPFYIRIKNNTISSNDKGLSVDIDGLFYKLEIGKKRAINGKRKVFCHDLYLTGLRLTDGDLLIVASNINNKEHDAIEIYAKRWEIETLFSCLKSRGFRFEETHVTNQERIKKLLVLLAIGFCWAHKMGEWRHESKKPIKVKKHGRFAKSFFRYGLDYIREAILKVLVRSDFFRDCLNIIKLPLATLCVNLE